MSMDYLFAAFGIGGYFLGSIPFGLVLCYLAGYGDIRKIGSGNIGATNVLRTGNKTLALLTVILDASKAGMAAWLACKFVPADVYYLCGVESSANVIAALIAGSLAIIGHNFPVWLKFKGGKGVASAFGFVLVMTPKIALLALLIWLAMAFAFRYSSLSAIVAATAVPVLTYFMSDEIHTVFYTAIVVLILVRHHANFARLFRGEESKITFKKKS
ncbi:MAG: glycerol-3-phosphate 1-O-acyltransferase PlsY [Alphaproteobacteria bacterium]|nr:glycerol-3-phosphate 1-O-acyltransferase PlsY [Alphaproteobacteria bacterium]